MPNPGKVHIVEFSIQCFYNAFCLTKIDQNLTKIQHLKSKEFSWGSGRGLLEVYQGWTDAASAGDLEEVY